MKSWILEPLHSRIISFRKVGKVTIAVSTGNTDQDNKWLVLIRWIRATLRWRLHRPWGNGVFGDQPFELVLGKEVECDGQTMRTRDGKGRCVRQGTLRIEVCWNTYASETKTGFSYHTEDLRVCGVGLGPVGCNMVHSGLWKKLATVDGWVDTGMEVTLKIKLCLERLWFLFVSSRLTKGLPCALVSRWCLGSLYLQFS